jgi:hypothetical protein
VEEWGTVIEFRDYQVTLAKLAAETVKDLGLAYLAMQVRTGKTLTALLACQNLGAKQVLFITKKKAIASIEEDYAAFSPDYSLTVTNYESLHKVDIDPDIVILDEAHRLGAFPKPCVAARVVKEKFSTRPIIFLSGTPSPESYSQLYHQFWVSQRSPFASRKTFYAWARDFVSVQKKMIGSMSVNDYSDAYWDLVEHVIKPYMISYTQADAGFAIQLKEHFCWVPMDPKIATVSNLLLADGVVQGRAGIISAANAAVLQQKIQQLHSGTIILDPEKEGQKGIPLVLSKAKAEYIADRWPKEKLVIFYQFQAELTALKEVLGDRLTTDIDIFNMDPAKSYAGQFVSSREGVNLSKGDLIIAYNISHSATTYQQFRDRLTTKERKNSDIYWLFSEDGIERKIYDVVCAKKNYTATHFRRDYARIIGATTTKRTA